MTGQQLKNSILQMAVQGKLVPQDPNDEPASVLLERIHAEKERLIKEKKIKNVEFLGFKAGEELEEIIKGARFTLIPSIWYDNLPNTALESFQYSKPVIASNIGSLPELVLDGVNGYLFKPADAQELCEKVALLDDDAVVKKMGAASRDRLEDRFAPQTHYNTLMRIFDSVRRK